MNKRVIGLFLSIALLLPSLSSCAESEPDGKETDAAAETQSIQPETQETEEETVSRVRKDLALRTFDDRTFRIFSRARNSGGDWSVHDMTADELTGDVLNDAIYTRNQFLYDTYHYVIELTDSSNASPAGEIQKLVAASDLTYDTFGNCARDAASLAANGTMLDLRTLNYLSLDDEWWSPSLCAPLTTAGHQYAATGDISVVPKEGVRAFYFNKNLLTDYQLESPYDLVADDKWIWDKLFSMMGSAATDLNGDGVMDGNDRYGVQGQQLMSLVLYQGAGETLIGKDEDDLWVYTAEKERSVEALMRVTDLFTDHAPDMYISDDWQGMLKMFENNQALFYTVLHIATMRGYDIDFGIIPTPKMDETQQSYSHYLDWNCNIVYSLPVTLPEPDDQAYILETIAYASRTDITPAYYDICLKSKYARDEESSEMLDIIFSSYHLELAEVYNWAGLADQVSACLRSSGNIASTLAKLHNLVQKQIDNSVSTFAENNKW